MRLQLLQTQGFLIAATVAVMQTAAGAQPSNSDVSSWIKSEWEKSRAEPEFLAGSVFKYSTAAHSGLAPSQLAAMRAEVAGKIDHPLRAALETEERRLLNGGDRTASVVLYAGRGQWRYNTEASNMPAGWYSDIVRTSEHAWMLAPQQLTIMDQDSTSAEGYGKVLSDPAFLSPLRLFMFGGFGYYDLKLSEPTVSGNQWRVHASSVAGDWVMEYHGEWDEPHRRGFVREMRVARNEGGIPAGMWWQFADWARLSVSGGWAASRVARFAPGAVQPEAEWHFQSCELADPTFLKSALAIPRVDESDSFRGIPKFSRVYDARTKRDLGQTALTGSIPNVRVDRDQPAQTRLLRVIGWILAGSITIAIMVLRLTRRREPVHRPSHPQERREIA